MGLLTRPTNALLKRLVFLANTQGIIPNPVDALQVMEMGYQNDAGTTEIYEVPANRVLYMTSCWVSLRLSADGSVEGGLDIRDGNDAIWKNPNYLRMDKAGQIAMAQQFRPGIKIPAGYDISITSGNANLDMRGGFYGWLEVV